MQIKIIINGLFTIIYWDLNVYYIQPPIFYNLNEILKIETIKICLAPQRHFKITKQLIFVASNNIK